MISQALATDSLRTVLSTVFAAPKYAWVPRVEPGRWLWDQVRRLIERFAGLETTAPLLFWTVVGLLVAVLVAIVVHAGYIMVGAMRYASARDAHERPATAERRDGGWHRDRAARLAAEGRYPDAVRALFEGMVLDLDASGALRWHPSKTPREYAREARLDVEDRARLRALVDGVYAYSFAGLPCGPAEWEGWRQLAGGRWHVE